MKFYSIVAIFIWLLAFVSAAVDGFKPKVGVTKLDEVASEIIYFDDTSNILALRNHKVSISFTDGEKWEPVQGLKDEIVLGIRMDPFVNQRALVFTANETHYVTEDGGKSFTPFAFLVDKKPLPMRSPPRLSYNAKNKDLVLISYFNCPGPEFSPLCKMVTFYTKDGFKSNPSKLASDLNSCHFAKSTEDFTLGPDTTIYCSRDSLNSFGHVVESNLVTSNDFFKTETTISHQLTKSGRIIDIKVELSFIILVVQNDKFNSKSKVALLISKDGENFDEADLKIGVAYGIMTFLESTPLSLFLSVMDYSNSITKFSSSVMYASDSSGLKFHKVLDKVQGGAIQKVQTIDGVWLANTAEDNSKDDDGKTLLDLLISGGSNKIIKSQVTLNDGKDWNPLVIKNDDSCKSSAGCSLHVLTPAERDGEGNFVTGPTPGILMVVGNKGEKLERDITKMSTYISRDGGATWELAIKEPCLFSFGDLGNIIIGVPYFGKESMSTKRFYYSVDQGATWQETALETGIYPLTLATTVDGTSTKFILAGLFDKTPDEPFDNNFSELLYYIDFSDAFGGKKCNPDKDFETIYARISPDNDSPTCVYGHTQSFQRRKQDAQCFVNQLYLDLQVYEGVCECNESDFECGPGFKLSQKGACVPDPVALAIMCSRSKGKELNLPDKVLVSGNKCEMKKPIKHFVTQEKLKCSDYKDFEGNSGEIVAKFNEFDGKLTAYSYIDPAENYTGENVIVLTERNTAYASNNGGVDFVRIPVPDQIVAFYIGKVPDHLILITGSTTIYVSVDGGNSFKKQLVPARPSALGRVISFNGDDVNQFIWFGEEGCEVAFSPDCKRVAYLTTNGGESFTKLIGDVNVCDFINHSLEKKDESNKDLIYCSVNNGETSKLLSSQDLFKSSNVLFDNIVGYAVIGKFVVVASVDVAKKALKAKVTVDGTTFADADFPADFHVGSQQAYTVLDAQSQSVFMHVTTDNEKGSELGAILKSNSNGTSYVLSLDKVNRNSVGYVDYDRIDELEGVIISNVVINPHSKDGKKLKTEITHNDGGEWRYIAPPAIDANGKKYDCYGSSLEECSLNLHGFTERADYRDTFSSASAVGLMIGVGNVGKHLENYDKGSTFLTRDGGITWKAIKDSVYMWEYGDRGTILVLVKSRESTDSISYSLDEGNTWKDFKFAKSPIQVLDLATVPSDTSRKFLIFGQASDDKKNTISYSIDFSNIYKRQCQLDLDNPNNDDYEYWTPKHPLLADNCLFGHEAKYLRRAMGHNDCFIGSAPLKEGFKVTRNCSCTRKDFECDYNFYRDSDDTCKLVKGLSPSDRKNEVCKKDSDAFRYFEPTGYRKIPISTCSGGKEFDKWNAVPCPGKEKEFNKFYGRETGFGAILLIIGLPLAVFFFATWFVYDRGIRRNGGFKRFGQIRLDEDDFQPIENNGVDKVVNNIVRGGIYVAAVSISAFKTIRKVDRAILDRIVSSIFGRRPGHRNYVQVPDEEDELFGNFQDNYEEELEEGADVGSFVDNEPESDLGTYTDEPATADDTDSRLFHIDDQSDEESTPTDS